MEKAISSPQEIVSAQHRQISSLERWLLLLERKASEASDSNNRDRKQAMEEEKYINPT